MKKHWWTFTAIFAVVIMVTTCKYPAAEFVQGDMLDLNGFVEKNYSPTSLDSMEFISKQPVADCTSVPLTRDDLSNMRTVVQIYTGNRNAGLTVPGFGGIQLGTGESNLNVYYIESKVVDTSVYGIGYSVHYLFKKVKKGLDISNIPSICASVQLESSKTQVLYSLQSYGMKGINLVRYFKPTLNKNFDVEGFGVMQSSIDGIHNVLGDTVLSKTVKFTPEILNFVKPNDLK